jgi:hypothetical protein
MRSVHVPAILLACLLVIGMVPVVSAFTLTSITVTPQGNQPPGTPLTVNAVIDFPAEGGQSFSAADELRLSTDLLNPRWTPVLVLDGTETSLPDGNDASLAIAGDYLSYPASQDMRLRVKLTGTIRAYPVPGQNLLNVQETDANRRVVSSARVAMPETPVPVITGSVWTRKPTTKVVFTPIETAPPTQASPFGTGAGILALFIVALHVVRRR